MDADEMLGVEDTVLVLCKNSGRQWVPQQEDPRRI